MQIRRSGGITRRTFTLWRIALLLVAAAPTAESKNTLVALTGQQADGLPEGVLYSDLGAAAINDQGRVAFLGFMLGPGITPANEAGAWYQDGAGTRLAVQSFDVAPAPNAARRIWSFDGPIWSGSDELALRGYLSSNFDLQAAYRVSDDGLRQVVGNQQPVPGFDGLPLPGSSWGFVAVTAASSNGNLAIFGGGDIQADGFDSSGGIWIANETGTRAVALLGQQAPGAMPGSGFVFLGEPPINQRAHTVFQGELSGPGFGSDLNSAIWTNRGGSLTTLAQPNGQASEFGAGVTFLGFTRQNGRPSINDLDEIVFHAIVAGPGVVDDNDQGLLVDDGSGRRLVVRSSDPVPGVDDAVFGRLDLGDVVINNSGQVAFGGMASGDSLPGRNASGIWVERSEGVIETIALNGDRAPGTDRADTLLIDTQQSFALNALGQVAFMASIDPRAPRDPAVTRASWPPTPTTSCG